MFLIAVPHHRRVPDVDYALLVGIVQQVMGTAPLVVVVLIRANLVENDVTNVTGRCLRLWDHVSKVHAFQRQPLLNRYAAQLNPSNVVDLISSSEVGSVINVQKNALLETKIRYIHNPFTFVWREDFNNNNFRWSKTSRW